MTDIPSLIERETIEQAQRTYATNLVHGNFAAMEMTIKGALSRLTASRIPGEIEELIGKLKARSEDRAYFTQGNFAREAFFEWQAAAALERMARHIAYLTDEVREGAETVEKHAARIRELEAERVALHDKIINDILLTIPGGNICDPQVIADGIRALKEES